MDHVLVGVDGSPDSLVALRWAGRFAAVTKRELHVAHAWQHGRRLEGAFATPHTDGDAVEAAIVEGLQRLVERELGDVAPVSRCLALRGQITEALQSEASRTSANLIVVGARGTGGALRRLLGSVSRGLTECPVHAVAVVPPDGDHTQRSSSMVVAVDGSLGSSRALRWAGEASCRSGAEIVVVHAFESPIPDPSAAEVESLEAEAWQRLDEEWCAPLRALGVPHRTVLEWRSAPGAVRSVADSVRPNCVVVGSRGLGPISQRVLGSVTHQLVRDLDWPIVVVPSARDRAIWPPG